MSAAASAVSTRSSYSGSVAVIALQLDGRGDIAIGRMLADIVKTILPKATVHFSSDKCVLLPYESVPLSKKSTMNILTEQDKKDWGIEDISMIYKKIKDGEISLVFAFPPVDERHVPTPIREGKMPIIRIPEYLFFCYPDYKSLTKMHSQGSYPLGAKTCSEGSKSVSELGFVFPEELYQYGLAHQSDSATVRLTNLKDFPLSQLILDAAYSEDAVKAFAATSRLYSGYAHDLYYAHNFILAICSMEDQTGDVTIWMTNNLEKTMAKRAFDTTEKDYTTFLKKPANHRAIFDGKFQSVQILSGENQVGQVSFGERAKGKRKLRIIFKPLDPKTNILLDKSSEKETIRSGSASLFEAYSLRKITAFCISAHHSDLMGDLVMTAQKINPIFSSLLKAAYAGKSFELRKALEEGLKEGSMMKMNHKEIREGIKILFQVGKTPREIARRIT